MKLVEMELEKSIPALFRTGAFNRYFEGSVIKDYSPQHFICLDKKFVIYMDYKLSFYVEKRLTRYSIMDWSKIQRPEVSFEDFLLQTTDRVREKILFNVDLF